MRIQKVGAQVGAVAVCAVLLTACNDDSPAATDTTAPTSAPASSATSDPATTAAATTPPPPATPDGDKLKTVLPSAATLPSGWKIQKGGETDSSNGLADPGPAVLPTDTCNNALTGASPYDLVSDYQAAWAKLELLDPELGANTLEFSSYQGQGAGKLLAEIKAVVKRCGTYDANGGDGKKIRTTVTLKSLPGLGEEAYELKVVPTGSYEGADDVLVRSGDVVMAVNQGSTDTGGTALVALAKRFAAPLPVTP
jgi:hypothetical protein